LLCCTLLPYTILFRSVFSPVYLNGSEHCAHYAFLHFSIFKAIKITMISKPYIDFFQKRNEDILIHALKFLKKILFNFFYYWQIVDIITHVDYSFFVFWCKTIISKE